MRSQPAGLSYKRCAVASLTTREPLVLGLLKAWTGIPQAFNLLYTRRYTVAVKESQALPAAYLG